MLARMMSFAADEKTGLPMAHHLGAGHAAKRAQGRKEVNRFQDIGLALRIITQKQMEARRELEIEPRIVSKIAEPQMAEMHAKQCDGTVGN